MDSAEISMKASALDVTVFEVASAHGKTDADGSYRFDIALPKYFAGRPLNHGAARVLIEATVKDSAGHAETRGQPITVSESPLLITAVPGGRHSGTQSGERGVSSRFLSRWHAGKSLFGCS